MKLRLTEYYYLVYSDVIGQYSNGHSLVPSCTLKWWQQGNLKQNHISEDIVVVVIIIIFIIIIIIIIIIIPVTTSKLMRNNSLSEELKLKY